MSGEGSQVVKSNQKSTESISSKLEIATGRLFYASKASRRPQAVEALAVILASADVFASSAKLNSTIDEARGVPTKFTDAEIEGLVKLASDARNWLDENAQRQERLQAYEDPILRVADVERKSKEVENEVGRLRKKKVPKKAKVTSGKTSSAGEPAPEPSVGDRPKDEL
ncbi:hypothetical protein P7C70_g4535, partial [Phenoliferia sp. Uapishka_3]